MSQFALRDFDIIGSKDKVDISFRELESVFMRIAGPNTPGGSKSY